MTFNEVKAIADEAYVITNTERGCSNLTLYPESNEHLCEIFNNVDVSGKDIFTVLGSSDQALSCYYCGAKTIDTFDMVHPSLWYGYLRKWIILNQNRFYPSYHFFTDGDEELYNLICKIVPTNQDEADAQLFWKLYLSKEPHRYMTNYFLFNAPICSQDKPFLDDIDSVKHFYDNPISFKHLNICKPIDTDKQYDVVILSNILEHTVRDKEKVTARENVESLLKDNGIAVCSSLIYNLDTPFHKHEVDVLISNDLELVAEYQDYEELVGRNRDIAYVYQKKKRF